MNTQRKDSDVSGSVIVQLCFCGCGHKYKIF